MASPTSSTAGARFSYAPSHGALNTKRQLRTSQRAVPSGRRAGLVVRAEGGGINPEIRKNEEKVVDSIQVSELSKPLTAYCRCWRSGKFPLCDGTHVKHNKATGDNVGPLLLKK